MIYKVRQVTDRFSTPINNSEIREYHSIKPLSIGSIFWSNNLTDDNLSGEYEVLEQIDK